MGVAKKIRMLFIERDMKLADAASNMIPPSTSTNLSKKLSRDNLSEKDIASIAQACNASYEIIFTLNDTGKKI